MRDQKLYAFIANTLQAIENCKAAGNAEWQERHAQRLYEICKARLPSGSGFDSGTTLDGRSTPHKLVFTTSFHHMTVHGYYDAWTEHTVTITADLALGFTMKISGRNRSDIKDYIAEAFNDILHSDVTDTDISQLDGVLQERGVA